MRKIFLLGLLLLLSLQAFAVEDFYHFDTEKAKARFDSLTSELRCLVCQNQTLAESNAPLATDLREQIYHKIEAGQSNQQIRDYLVERYGHFILYRPPFNPQTLILWIAPFLCLFFGLFFLIFFIKNQKRG